MKKLNNKTQYPKNTHRTVLHSVPDLPQDTPLMSTLTSTLSHHLYTPGVLYNVTLPYPVSSLSQRQISHLKDISAIVKHETNLQYTYYRKHKYSIVNKRNTLTELLNSYAYLSTIIKLHPEKDYWLVTYSTTQLPMLLRTLTNVLFMQYNIRLVQDEE